METLAIAFMLAIACVIVGAIYLAFTEPPDWYTYK